MQFLVMTEKDYAALQFVEDQQRENRMMVSLWRYTEIVQTEQKMLVQNCMVLVCGLQKIWDIDELLHILWQANTEQV